MVPASPAQFGAFLARGANAVNFERALSALWASTFGGSVSGVECHRRKHERKSEGGGHSQLVVGPLLTSAWRKVIDQSVSKSISEKPSVVKLARGIATQAPEQSYDDWIEEDSSYHEEESFGSRGTRREDRWMDRTFGRELGEQDDEESVRKRRNAIKENISMVAGGEFGPEAVNKFYTLSDEDKTKYLAEGLPKGLEREFELQTQEGASADHRVLVRQQSLDLFARVKRLADERRDNEYRALVLVGPKGSGKSVSLAMLVRQCRSAGWLALYVPSGESWISGKFYNKDEASGFFDTPVQAEAALKAMLAAHGDLLETLPIRVPLSAIGPVFGGTASVEFDEEELPTGTLEEGNLKSLVEKGLEEEGENAGKILARLRVELSRVTEVPVLIAIDEYNCWFGTSAYGEVNEDCTRTRRIAASELRLVHAFGQLDGPLGLKNGVVVAAKSETLPLPRDVKKMPGVYKQVRRNVERLTLEETGAILTNYFACGAMLSTARKPTDHSINVAQCLFGGNGAELRYYAPLLQKDAKWSPETSQSSLEGGANRGGSQQNAPRIRNFVESLSSGI